ncbi:MAG TPA: sugar-binding domain-containing protein [Bacilli bacterium]
MRTLLDIQKHLLPDLMEVMKKRYEILHLVMLSGTVGRRVLAGSLGISERVLRAEVDFLKVQGLLDIDNSGMRISPAGKRLLQQLEPLIKELFGLTEMEEAIKSRYGLRQVVVVPGDADNSHIAKKELGRAAAGILRKIVEENDVIAVTGGSTMAEVALWLTQTPNMKGNWFVPARGGLGESVEFQANTIASDMAKRTGGQYRMLHVPDHLSEEAYQSLSQEPNIREVVAVIRRARIVVHGIGDAIRMAKRRNSDALTLQKLREEGALAEAFGYYFNRAGQVVHKMQTLGLRLEDIHQTEAVIAVAGGTSKGQAIAAVLRYGRENILVTDEAAAQEIIKANGLS